ncbi:MAG: metallo-beta-lactamase family protein [Gemmatimonadetes bacterium]|nr:metallo-beta-lactamase family protein [Gemmatimonadota bacterium]
MSDESGKGTVKLRWLGHAAFEIESSGGTKILIDPFIKDNPVTPEPLKKLDRYKNADKPSVICVSHSHGDHSADAKEIAKLSGAPVIGMIEWVSALGLSSEQSKGGNIGGEIRVGDVSVHLVPATHSTDGGSPIGFVIEFADGRTLYHTGDTWIMSDMALIEEVHHPDIVLTCAGGGPYTQSPTVAALAMNKFFNPSVIVPMHYATFPVIATEAEVRTAFARDSRAVIMKPGETKTV